MIQFVRDLLGVSPNQVVANNLVGGQTQSGELEENTRSLQYASCSIHCDDTLYTHKTT
jgi:hypothetical protein